MRTNMHMTIQDYFNRNRYHPVSGHAQNGRTADVTEGDVTFAGILDRKRSSAVGRPCGLTIQDYLARPVQRGLPAPSQRDVPDQLHTFTEPAPIAPEADPVAAPAVLAASPASAGDLDAANGHLPRVEDRIEASIERAANRHRLPTSLVRAVVRAESGFQVRAVSPAGARGLMQLMPATAREMGVTDPFDIDQNINGGAKYLRVMMDRFNGDVKLALSAYNAGPGTVAKYNGKVPYVETRNYVDRVLRFARRST